MRLFLQLLFSMPLMAVLAHLSMATFSTAAESPLQNQDGSPYEQSFGQRPSIAPPWPEYRRFLSSASFENDRAIGGNIGTWSTIPPQNGSPTARHETGFVQAGDKFYLMGGRGNKDIEVYDPVAQSWSDKDRPPIQMHHYQAVELDGLIYAAGAFTGGCCAEPPIEHIYIYDPFDDEWIRGPAIPSERRRGSAGTVVYNDQLYLVSGIQVGHQSGWVPWTDRYDPATNSWLILEDAPRSRDHFHAALANGKIYAAGGRRSGADGIFNATVAEVDVYDLATGEWETLPNDIPTQRAGTMAATLNNEVIIIGGESGGRSEAHAQTEALNIFTNQWRDLALLNEDRHGSQAIVSNGGIYVVSGSGGRGGGPELSSLEAFYFDAPTIPAGDALIEPSLAPAQSTVDGGPVVQGESRTVQLELQNSGGNQALVLTNIALSGDAEFIATAPYTLPFVVAPDESTVISITLAPNAIQTYSAAMTIEHSGANGETQVSLQGEGVEEVPANTAPTVVAPIEDYSVDEEAPSRTINLAQVFSDAEESATALTYQIVSNSNSSVVQAALSPPFLLLGYLVDASGSATIAIRATDSEGLFVEERFTVTVRNVNDPPTLSQLDDVTMTEGQRLTISVSATDPDGEPLGFSMEVAPPWNGAILNELGGNSARLTFTANQTDEGTYQVTLTATDPSELMASTTFSITVEEQNQPPSISVVSQVTLKESERLTMTVAASDPDGDPIVIDGRAFPSFVTLTDQGSGNGFVVVAPSNGDAGEYTLFLRATDSDGLFDEKRVSIQVTEQDEPPNQAPQLPILEPLTITQGTALTLTLFVVDPDGDSLTITATNAPSGTTFSQTSAQDATLAWGPMVAAGTYSLTVRAEDEAGLFDQGILVVTVQPTITPQPPELVNDLTSFDLKAEQQITLTLTFTDPNNETIRLTASNLPVGALWTDAGDGNGLLMWHPTEDQVGIHDLLIVATNESGLVVEQPIRLTVAVLPTGGGEQRPIYLPMGLRE